MIHASAHDCTLFICCSAFELHSPADVLLAAYYADAMALAGGLLLISGFGHAQTAQQSSAVAAAAAADVCCTCVGGPHSVQAGPAAPAKEGCASQVSPCIRATHVCV